MRRPVGSLNPRYRLFHDTNVAANVPVVRRGQKSDLSLSICPCLSLSIRSLNLSLNYRPSPSNSHREQEIAGQNKCPPQPFPLSILFLYPPLPDSSCQLSSASMAKPTRPRETERRRTTTKAVLISVLNFVLP